MTTPVRQFSKWLEATVTLHVQEGQTGKWLLCAGVSLIVLVTAGAMKLATGASLKDLEGLGYPGIFVVMFFSGGSIFLPVPGMASVIAAGTIWNPVLIGIAAGIGNSLGETTGYVAGKAGAAVLEGRHGPGWWSVMKRYLERHAFLIIVAMAIIPNPVFDTVGLLAGSINYPLRRFWLACLIGNTVKYTAVAYFGVYLGETTRHWLGWVG